MHALVLGATGAVGSALVRELLASDRWTSVRTYVRRPARMFDGVLGASKLIEHVMDLENLEGAIAIDDDLRREEIAGGFAAFCTLGVGQPRKVSREELRRVDVGIAGAFARGCRAAAVPHFSLLTAVGANARSRSYYLRVKGEIEQLVIDLHFQRASFFRPSLLVTRQLRYGLQDRITQAVFPRISPMMPSRYREVTVENLAHAMRVNAERPGVEGSEVLEHDDFVRLQASWSDRNSQ